MARETIVIGDQASHIYVAYSKSLNAFLKATQFLKHVSFDVSTLNEKEDAYEVAKKWVKANPNVVNNWLIKPTLLRESFNGKNIFSTGH
jgi:ABC-type proline/glycine betaine transport system substrate-binding protein